MCARCARRPGRGRVAREPHVTIVYSEVVGEFVYLRDDLVDIEVLLEHTPLGEVPMVYELRTSGMACGPVSYRLWVESDLV
jgi:hypothetical protein